MRQEHEFQQIRDAEELRVPLGRLGEEDCAFLVALLACALSRPKIIDKVCGRFSPGHKRNG